MEQAAGVLCSAAVLMAGPCLGLSFSRHSPGRLASGRPGLVFGLRCSIVTLR